ncbi:MAG: FUSC family protein [Thermoplasmata archaeon]
MSSNDTTHARWREFARSLVRLENQNWDFSSGLRAAVIILIPLAVGVWGRVPLYGVLATLGALNLLMVTAPKPGVTKLRILGLACLTNAIAFAAGTLVATLPDLLEAPFVVIGVALALLLGADRDRVQLALITAVLFVLGIGLPGASANATPIRLVLVALGGGWALLAVLLTRRLAPWSGPSSLPSATDAAAVASSVSRLELVAYEMPVALAVGAGFLLGVELGLPRDFWIMLTVLVALRLDILSTLAYSTMRILGTVGGATVALVISIATANGWLLGVALAVAVTLMAASRAVNYIIFAFTLTIFVILLLDLVFAGGPYFAEVRILDTVIGGGIALLTGSLLWLATNARTQKRRIDPRLASTKTSTLSSTP